MLPWEELAREPAAAIGAAAPVDEEVEVLWAEADEEELELSALGDDDDDEIEEDDDDEDDEDEDEDEDEDDEEDEDEDEDEDDEVELEEEEGALVPRPAGEPERDDEVAEPARRVAAQREPLLGDDLDEDGSLAAEVVEAELDELDAEEALPDPRALAEEAEEADRGAPPPADPEPEPEREVPRQKAKSKSKAKPKRAPAPAPLQSSLFDDSPSKGGSKDQAEVEAPAVAKAAPGPAGLSDLLFEAGALILEQNRVAVSMLQRRFELDFDAATEVLDQLQSLGLIGPYLGGKTRDILMTREEWMAFAHGV